MLLTGVLINGGPRVTVSGESITASDPNSPHDTTASVKFDNDGNVYKGVNIDGGGTVFTQIDSVTDWIRPASVAPGNYEIRFTSLAGDTGIFTGFAAEDSWVALTSDRINQISTTSSGTFSVSFTIEIRLGSTTLDSASYTLEIINTSL